MSDACVLVRLAPELAAQFPPAPAGEGPPHVTVAYIPAFRAPSFVADISAALRTAALVGGPFALALTGGLHLFPPNDRGETPVCIAVQSEGLLGLRRRFLAALGATWPAVADAADAAHGGYVPHATVRYARAGEALEVDPRPKGGMVVDAVELWVGDELVEVVQLKPAAPPPIALSALQAVRLTVREVPEGVRIYNRGGYHQGRPFRTASEAVVYDVGGDGERRVALTPELMAEIHNVFTARAGAGEYLPKLNYGHRPAEGAEAPVFFGVVLGMFVAADERGVGLYVVPGWTDRGRAHVEAHLSPDGTDSILYSSPELRIGPRYARSEGNGETGKLLGHAEIVGVALTEYPAQSEGLIDPVTLSAHTVGGTPMGPKDGGAAPPKVNLSGGEAPPAPQLAAPAAAAGQAMAGEAATEDKATTDALAARLAHVESMLEQLLKHSQAAQPATDAPTDMAAEGEDDKPKGEDMAAALSAAEASKDPAARALAAKLRANLSAEAQRKAAEADKARTDATKAAEARIQAVEVQLAAERKANHEAAARREVEALIQSGQFSAAEREDMVALYLDGHPQDAANLSAEAKGVVERHKRTWQRLCAERAANPAVHMSANGTGALGGASDGEAAFHAAVEEHAAKHNLSGDYREKRMHFRSTDRATYDRLMAAWK